MDRPHFKYPFQRDPVTHKVQVVEQDTPEHIVSCEGVIIACPAGFRLDRPEFGWEFPTFRNQPIDTDALVAALRAFEPRSESTAENVLDDAEAIARVNSGVALIEVDIPVVGDDSG